MAKNVEKNNSRKIKTLLSSIKGISNQYEVFFQSIENLEIPFRDAMIEDIYQKILIENEFYTEVDASETDSLKVKKPIKFEKEQYIKRLLTQIKRNPKKRSVYLKEFLNSFVDISDADKKVILNSILTLDEQHLKEQITNLMNTFKFSI